MLAGARDPEQTEADERGTTPAVTTDYRFAPVPEELAYDPEISGNAVKLYAILARHGMDPEHCFPSHARIAAKAGLSDRSIGRILGELEDAGWISKRARFTEAGARTSDGYHVHSRRAQERAHHAEERGTPAHESVEPPAHESAINESKLNESNTNDNALVLVEDALPVADDGFETFWKAYPRKTAKAGARKVWARAVKACKQQHPEYTPGAIIDGAIRYAEDPNRDDRYTAHATTWLNQERWNDPALPSRTGNRAQERVADNRGVLGNFLTGGQK